MAEEANTKNSKKIIAIVVAAIVVIAAAVATVIIINNNNKGKDDNNNQGNNQQTTTLNDDFFKSTDTKVVLSTASNSTDSTVAKKVHQVYTLDGDKITGLTVYSEFDSEESAKATDAKPEMEEGVKAGKYVSHKVEGKYVIVVMPESMYQSVTATDIKAAAAAIEQAVQSGVDQQTQTQTTETQAQTTEGTAASATSETEE